MDKKRIAGLDILRTVAIITVVFTHSKYFIAPYFPSVHFLSLPPGSDLFFALSGYLIGSTLIKQIEQHQTFTIQLCFDFLKRRWFRTLPNYFLFLLLNIVLVYFGLIKGELNKFLITYFFFVQNLFKPYDFLFWESWNVSVQEWFYFSFPFILLLFFVIPNPLRKPRNIMLCATLMFLIFPFLYRISQPMPVDRTYWDLFFRKLVATRFDGIGFGLLGAFIKNYYPVLWNKSKMCFIIGCCMIVAVCAPYFENHVMYYKTIYFTLLGFSILLLLPFMESIKNEQVPFKPFQFISKISYSIFLIHIPFAQLLLNHQLQERSSALLLYTIYWIGVILLSKFIYTCFEKPLMDYGERFYRVKAQA